MNKAKKSFIINTLRRGSYRWHTRYKAAKRAHIGRNEYVCESCGLIVTSKEKQMDHVLPVHPVEGTDDLNVIADRMYPDTEAGWQTLCKPCHLVKSNIENEQRRNFKK